MWSRLKEWLLSWLPRRPAHEEERFDLYKPHERLIYSYWDGSKTVHADPMILWRKVMAIGPELSVDIKVANSPMKDAANAHQKMLQKIRDLFGVKPFEEGGLTETESIALFDHFMVYCNVQKKTGREPPTSPGETSPSTPSPPPPSGGGSSSASPPTGSSSGSGSTGTESSTSGPTASTTEPPTPSAPSPPDSTTTSP